MKEYGTWAVHFDLDVNGEKLDWDELDKLSKLHILDYIMQGYMDGTLTVEMEDVL